MPTRQTSSSGRPKSPRIQVVLPEELCARLTALADADSRTVSNMAKVLIQQGVERMERQRASRASRATVDAASHPPGSQSLTPGSPPTPASASAEIRAELEQRQQQVLRPLRRGPRRLRLQRPPL